MPMGPGREINTWGETETCGYTATATLRMLIINNCHNKTSVQTATSSMSSAALLGTSKDALNVSFFLTYLIREFLASFCVLCLKKKKKSHL